MRQEPFTCPKCGYRRAERDEIRTTGSGLSKIFDIQNRQFIAISCAQCGYTEFYRKGKSSGLSNIIDFFTN